MKKTPLQYDVPLARLPSKPAGLRRRALRAIYVQAVEHPGTRGEAWNDRAQREREVRRLMRDEAGIAQWEKFEADRIVPVDIPNDLEDADLEAGIKLHEQRWAEHRKLITEILPAAYAALRAAGLEPQQAFEKLGLRSAAE